MLSQNHSFQVVGKQAESIYFAAYVLPGDYRLPDGLEAARERAGLQPDAVYWGWQGRVWNEAPDGGMRSGPGELLFQVRRGGSRSGYFFVMRNDDLSIEAVREAGYSQPSIYVQLRARLVWMLGYEVAVAFALEIVEQMFGRVNSASLSRVDLTVDLTGWPVCVEDGARFVSRSRKRATNVKMDLSLDRVYDSAAGFTGFEFSKGAPLSCRIYDKQAEIKANKTKTWFYRIWRENGWDRKQRVWRIEFQIRREVLRELGFAGEAVGDLEKLDSTWRYLTEDWMRYCVPRGSRRSRWETAPAWKAVQGAVWNVRADEAAVRRADQRPPEREHLRLMLLGVGSSYAAGYGARDTAGVVEMFSAAMGRMAPGEMEAVLDLKRRKFAGLSVVKDTPIAQGRELLDFDAISEKLIGLSED